MPDRRYNFDGKKVLVMGLGRFGGGVDVAEFATKAGAKVIVTDLASRRQSNANKPSVKVKPISFEKGHLHLACCSPVRFLYYYYVVKQCLGGRRYDTSNRR